MTFAAPANPSAAPSSRPRQWPRFDGPVLTASFHRHWVLPTALQTTRSLDFRAAFFCARKSLWKCRVGVPDEVPGGGAHGGWPAILLLKCPFRNIPARNCVPPVTDRMCFRCGDCQTVNNTKHSQIRNPSCLSHATPSSPQFSLSALWPWSHRTLRRVLLAAEFHAVTRLLTLTGVRLNSRYTPTYSQPYSHVVRPVQPVITQPAVTQPLVQAPGPAGPCPTGSRAADSPPAGFSGTDTRPAAARSAATATGQSAACRSSGAAADGASDSAARCSPAKPCHHACCHVCFAGTRRIRSATADAGGPSGTSDSSGLHSCARWQLDGHAR